MNTSPTHRQPFCLLLALLALLASATGLLAQQAGSSPVKIFILAGQSNMLGQGNMTPVTTPGTMEYTVANDPGGDYQFLVDGGGAWVVRDDVWIRDQNTAAGGLTVGYGSNSGTVGPELGFGNFIGDLNGQQVLIVKAAWGGKSLAGDFRPPSSGPYPTPVAPGDTGFYYNEVLRLVNEATTNLGTYFPDYNAAGGYEIAGFGWHQGWNDRISSTSSAEYEVNMANFIRDIRTALGVPALPFVIATTGMDGGTSYTEVELAQRAMTDPYLTNATPPDLYPDFVGSVAVIDARIMYEGLEFWLPVEQSPVSQGYHWNRNAKTYVNLGLAMGDAMSIMAPGRCPFRPRATGGPGGVTLSWQNGTEAPTNVRILRNGAEIAAAAPTSPPTFLDAAAEPGIHNYELVFTMPGDPCDPLTTTLNGGITGLELSPAPGGFELTWTNNMAYDAIEVRRGGTLLEGALSGTATSYTDPAPPSSGVVTYTVVPTNGSSTPATVQINLDLSGQLGILDLILANGGINPATGSAWQAGDEYRLAFVSSAATPATSSDITTYNAFVQGLADAAGLDGGTWKVAGSTATVDARDNTGTNPGPDGAGVAVFLIDGVTKLAGNNTALWSGLDAPLDVDELGNTGITGNAHTGSETNGTALAGTGSRVLGGSNEDTPKVRNGSIASATQWMKIYNAPATSALRVYAISDPLVVVESSDNTPPTLDFFEDDKTGGPVLQNEAVTYTLTFSKAMNPATVETEDFENASGTAITVDSVSPTVDSSVFEVVVTPTGTGSLQLRVAAGATLEDLPGNALDPGSAIPDDTIITVNADTTPPSVDSFLDDVGGGPVFTGETVTYTVSFSKAMQASTVETGDFENASATAITVDSVSPTADPSAFEVAVTAGAPGTLRLRVAAGASLEDLAGNVLNPSAASPDNTIITINALPELTGQLGVLDVTANGGINPATGTDWQAGDQYRLAFVTSTKRDTTSDDIAVYNTHVQNAAAGSTAFPELGNGTWKVLGSTLAVNAKANTGTDAAGGVAVFLTDGSTVLATNNADLWNGTPQIGSTGVFLAPYLDENGVDAGASFQVATGSNSNGTANGNRYFGSAPTGDTKVTIGQSKPNNSARWMIQFNNNLTSALPFYALSDPLTVQSTGGGGNDYSDWIALFPDVGTDSGLGDDPDRDGSDNGVENFFGTDPSAFSAGLTAGEVSTGGGTTFTFTHPQNASPADDLTAFYQWSADLENFFGDGVANGGTTVTFSAATNTPSPGITTVTATITGPGTDQLFVIVGVSQTP